MVKDTGSGEFWIRLFQDLSEVVRSAGGMSAEPNEIKDSDKTIIFDRAGFFVQRKRSSEVISGWPRSLGGERF